MEYQNFDCEISEGCATVRFLGSGAPDMGALCDEIVDLMLRLQEDRAVRLILFTDGDHAFEFHHNLDNLSETNGQNQGFELLAADDEISSRIVTLIDEASKPVVAATRGDIRNFGLGFFMAADIRLASDKASFTLQNSAERGLRSIPDTQEPFRWAASRIAPDPQKGSSTLLPEVT